VRTETELPIGAVVPVALQLPEGPVPVTTRVIHVRSPELARQRRLQPGAGVQFIGADPVIRARVERYIDSIPAHSKLPSVRLLSIARDLLRTHGWTQLVEKDAEGSYCLTGALHEAAGEDETLYRRALRTIGERLHVPACSLGGYGCHCAIIGWNDAVGRTRFEVLEKLDEVIRVELGTAQEPA